MLQGVVSLLDPDADRAVRAIWKELELEFGLTAVQSALAPHFSWHVAENYPYSDLKQALTPIKEMITPFTIKTGGLGLFLKPEPVLFIQIIVTQYLLDLHEKVYRAIEPLCEGSLEYYRPGLWTPHITLAYQDLKENQLGEILTKLQGFDFDRWIEISNFAILCPTVDDQMELCRMDFSRNTEKTR